MISRWPVEVEGVHGAKAKKVYLQQQVMRLQAPDDELGGMLFLGLPSIVVHRIDAWSPLLPHSLRPQGAHRPSHNPRCAYFFPEILQRATDVDVGEREGAIPVAVDGHDGQNDEKKPQKTPYGFDGTQQENSTNSKSKRLSGGEVGMEAKDADLAQYLSDIRAEILVVVEGIDPVTSNTVGKIHSYTLKDIVFGRRFAACAEEGPDGVIEVDFDRFHALVGESDDPSRPEVQG